MKMISVKIADLSGPALDWAVGIDIGHTVSVDSGCVRVDGDETIYSPSTNWSQGGPLIDSFSPRFNVAHFRVDYSPCIDSTVLGGYGWGPTFLVAFCRSFVASCSVSEFVEVPADLLGESK